MDNSLMTYVGSFIAVAIMLGIGTLILGGSVTNCSTITGWNSTVPSANETTRVANAPDQTGWSLQCQTNNTQSQAGYNLLIITLIVLAAVVVLAVVRMLS